MEKTLFCLLALLIVLTAKGQHANLAAVPTAKDYLLKGKNQRIVAGVLSSVGSAMILAGTLIGISDIEHTGEPGYDDNSDLAGALLYGGLVVAAGSIPFSISSRKNTKKAIELCMNSQAMRVIKNGTLIDRMVPSFSIRMPL